MTEQLSLLSPDQVAELDYRLQAEQARAPHWHDPPRKWRATARPAPKADPLEWAMHAEECPTCRRTREDIAALRRGELMVDDEGGFVEPTVACPEGLRLMPMADLETAVGPAPWGQPDGHLLLRRLIDHARRLEGRHSPEVQRVDVGSGWRHVADPEISAAQSYQV